MCEAVSRPVNVLARPELTLADIAGAGAQRVSVGGWLTWVAVGALRRRGAADADAGDFSALGRRLPLSEWFAS